MIEATFETVFAAYRQLPLPDQRRMCKLLLTDVQILQSPDNEAPDMTPLTGNQTSDEKREFPGTNGIRWADQRALSQTMDKLFADLDIQGEPIGPEALQKLMEKEGLEPNELSRAIIAARDE